MRKGFYCEKVWNEYKLLKLSNKWMLIHRLVTFCSTPTFHCGMMSSIVRSCFFAYSDVTFFHFRRMMFLKYLRLVGPKRRRASSGQQMIEQYQVIKSKTASSSCVIPNVKEFSPPIGKQD